ncbi:hypothetical protein GCM10010279_44230 [Streptomyces mutabilis]|nr:hypothetical protein GCM10010279_44230 [Streptomyces mutabilis]
MLVIDEGAEILASPDRQVRKLGEKILEVIRITRAMGIRTVLTRKRPNAVPIPPVLVPLLHDHKARKEAAREAAGELWQEHDVVFSRPDGRPLRREPPHRRHDPE